MTALTLTILGAGPAWPNPGGACSGYLVAAGGDQVLVDCGPGVAGRLFERTAVRDLQAAVVSHMHPDHFLDLVPLRHAIKYGGHGGERPLRVLLPPGGRATLVAISRVLSGSERFFSSAFEVREYDPTRPLRLGAMTFSFRRVRHGVPSYAMRIAADRALVFSADTGPCEELAELAGGADLLLCEAALGSPAQEDPEKRGHLSPAEAGALARRAGVGRLLLTHCPADASDPDRAVEQARLAFGGLVERAREGACYTV